MRNSCVGCPGYQLNDINYSYKVPTSSPLIICCIEIWIWKKTLDEARDVRRIGHFFQFPSNIKTSGRCQHHNVEWRRSTACMFHKTLHATLWGAIGWYRRTQESDKGGYPWFESRSTYGTFTGNILHDFATEVQRCDKIGADSYLRQRATPSSAFRLTSKCASYVTT